MGPRRSDDQEQATRHSPPEQVQVEVVQIEAGGKHVHSGVVEHTRFAVGMQIPASEPDAYTHVRVTAGQGVPAKPPHMAVHPVTYTPPT